MGENLILNMESKGFTVACFNRTVSKVDDFMAGPAKGTNIIPTHSIEELCGSLGYQETELLEKFARDSKILDIFEGTQQIQQLIVARRVLGESSSELK